MGVSAHSFMTLSANSLETGRALGDQIRRSAAEPPALVVTYLTVNHDQQAFLHGLREALGEPVRIVGCSAQGVVGRGLVQEEGYAAGALALGGSSLAASHGAVVDIVPEPFAKGAELGRQLTAGLTRPPKVVVLHYDSLCGVDPDRFLAGLYQEVKCPILGGAAGHSYHFVLNETYQYIDARVLTRAATAFALAGDFTVEYGTCHGCSPVGVELTVTRARNNVVLEFDERRAYDVWAEICGSDTVANLSTALAIGLPSDGIAGHDYFVRAAYALDAATGGVTLGPTIAEGSTIMLHHRTSDDVLSGAQRLGDELAERLSGKRVRAVLGFECGARTAPFLGPDATLLENLGLQRKLGEDAAWLGMMPWGELCPIGGQPRFHNYSYPLLVLAE